MPISPSLGIKNGNLVAENKINYSIAQNTTTTVIIVQKDTSATLEIKIAPDLLDVDLNYDLNVLLLDGKDIPDPNNLPPSGVNILQSISESGIKNSQTITKNLQNLTPSHDYYLMVIISEKEGLFSKLITTIPNPFIIPANIYMKISGFLSGNDLSIPYKISKTFTTNSSTTTNDGVVGDTVEHTPPYNLNCSLIKRMDGIIGCVAGLLNFFWQVSSSIAELGGKFLDFLIYYSTNSSSYVSEFVKEGWAAVRDVANIFFIIALLYIAIKTILGLNVSDNKKLIGTIVLIALIINFSLFTTQVIIDASNILAKIFYNSMTPKNENGNLLEAKAGGEKSISVGLIDKFNPQKIVSSKDYKNDGGPARFVFITILLIIITLYTAYIFFAVGLLFVSRVVMLWFSMIFSPIAFASYTLPFDIPGLGHKEWWSELLKNAFLAPIFIFMLYLVVMFAGFLNEIVKYSDGAEFFQKIMSTVIPFVILMVLLMKAKDLAVKYSGEMGAAIMKGAKMVGGVALGAVTGGAAMLGSGLIGGGAAKLLGSKYGEKLKDAAEKKGMGGFAARMALKGTNKATKSTFDVRKTALGGGLSKATGMDFQSAKMLGLGSKEGGFKGTVEKKTKEKAEEFETYKTKMSDADVEKLQKEDKDGNKITTADQLNNERLRNFSDNIGKTGLISSLAYTGVSLADKAVNKITSGKGQTIENLANENYEKQKGGEMGKEYEKQKNTAFENSKNTEIENALKALQDERTKKGGGKLPDQFIENFKANFKHDESGFKEKYDEEHKKEFVEKEKVVILDSRAKNVKMGIGVALAAVSGGAGAAIGGSVLAGGLAGGAIGAGIGTGSIGAEAMREDAQDKSDKASFVKQLNTLISLDSRIKDLNKSLEGYTKTLEDNTKLPEEDNFVSGNKNSGFTVNQTKLEEKLTKLGIIAKKQELELKKLVERGGDTSSHEIDMAANSKKINELNKISTAVKERTNTMNTIASLEKDRKDVSAPPKKDEHKADSHTATSHAPAAAAHTPTAKHGHTP